MTDREIMQQALEALESSRVFVTTREKIKYPEGTEWYDERITALRERLAQPEQEPVAYIEHHKGGDNLVWDDPGGKRSPLYTAPPQRKPLTDEEIERACVPLGAAMLSFTEVARAIERAHGLITDKPALFDDLIEPVSIEELVFKNYLAPLRSKVTKAKLDTSGVHKRGGEFIEAVRILKTQPAQQEPVARSDAYDMIDRFLQNNLNSDSDYAEYSKALDSIYTTPAQRTWVGLTDEEILQTLDLVAYDTQAFDFAYRIEAKLKEKNT
jgi:hypothetical protein